MSRKKNKGVSRRKAWAAKMKDSPCHYCGKDPAGTVDHVIPISLGGEKTKRNCVPACYDCNQSRTPRRIGRFIIAGKYAIIVIALK